MGILSVLFGKKIENENRTRPFHINKTKGERVDWFSRTRPWHKVDLKIINALVNKFGDEPMFEVFVFISLYLNLINQYEKLPAVELETEGLICKAISNILCNAGYECIKSINALLPEFERNIKRLEKQYQFTRDAFESAIIIDIDQISAYLGIASTHMLFDKKEFALKYAKQGVEKINQLKAKNIDVILREKQPSMYLAFQDAEEKLQLIIDRKTQ